MDTPTITESPPAALLARLRRVSINAGKFVVTAFLVLATFGFLTSGMSPGIPEKIGGDDANSELRQTASAAKFTDLDPVSLATETVGGERRDDGEWSHVSGRILSHWEDQIASTGLTAAPPADWLTVCRRLSLALVGSGLSLEEIRSLEGFPENQRIERHREALLIDPRFHDYWAERFTRFYVGADEGPFLVYRRRRFRTWLSDQIATQVPYDVLVRQLITAEGLWTDRPEVNFYTVTFDSGDGQPDPIRMAARTCRAFLGMRIDCMQCHDDFLGNVSMGNPQWMCGDGEFREGTQRDFHSLAAFFTAAKSRGLQGIRNSKANYRYQYLYETEEQVVAPEVPFRSDLLPTDGSNDRNRLATWMTHPENIQFSRAFVIRVWTLLFGGPPSESVDNLPLDEPPSPIIMTLAQAFIDSGYDIRSLIRWITDSPAFRVDSQSPLGEEAFEITTRHEQAMASFPITRLRAEQVAGAIIQAGRVKTLDRESALVLQLQQFGERNDFLKRYGDLGEDEFENETATIPQRLVLLNGKLTSEMSSWNPVLNTSAHVGMFAADDSAVVELLYLANLNRYPTASESEHFVARIAAADSRKNAIVDIVWVLLNSSEMAWNH
ncbi:DUF1549 domain-containing protein [Allorhodopirellula heiligendammensis]|uniref:DUF1549 domain-containing protein n=1 Tax=Allorhodopirellula heiligendammensis TaxID=2714739 RepID=A0A5C6BWD8_9BACT|nr:DUF1549 domain-containing protein [Allorhodopirellula heiligendammensis]TWU15791.1 hypothetical protein Poly21_29930 [Allorhodopirellula heiligendammensis]